MRSRPTRRDGKKHFSSNNRLGIPDLIPELCCHRVPKSLAAYRAATNGEALSFFVDDYRFQCAWAYPQRMVAALKRGQWSAVCEPDFSVWADAPMVEQIHAIYQTRWCGRLWQENGIEVIPVLNWSTSESYNFAFLGIPKHCPIVAVECVTCGANVDAFNQGLAAAVEYVQPKHLLIYGSRVGIEIPERVQPHWFPAYSSTIKSRKGATWAGEADHLAEAAVPR